jgi:hypothetical protein
MIHFRIDSIAISLVFACCLPLPANCQQTYNPNLSHFYMGRQQITIEDNTPIINNKTGSTAAGGGNGALLNRPVPLPQAGWQPYAPVETPGINPNLPKVPGPVRQSHKTQPNSGASGKKGHAGNLSPKLHGTSSPSNVRHYSPYAQYPPPAPNTQAAEDLSSSTRVKGSLLHWARHPQKQQ